MKKSLQITFRHMPVSEALSATLHEKMERLEHVCADIIGSEILIETPHHHHQQGRRFHVRLEIQVPGERIVITRTPEQNPEYEDVHVVVRDVFDAARRRLETYQEKKRGFVKNHSLPESETQSSD